MFFIITFNLFAAGSTGTGSASIGGGSIRASEKAALKNAMINAISSYYLDSNPQLSEKVDDEFIRLISKYRILERGVKGGSIYYKVEVTFDETASINVAAKSNPNTVVYLINIDKSLSAFKQTFYDLTKNYLDSSGMSLKYQNDFYLAVGSSDNLDKALSTFSISRARYFIYIGIKSVKDKSSSKLVTESYFYSKKDSFPVVKAEASLTKTTEQSVTEAYNKDIETTLNYIKSNFIKQSGGEPSDSNESKISMIFTEFKSFNDVMNVMDTLKSKGYFTTVKVKSFVPGKAEFEVVATSNIEQLKKITEDLLKNVNFDISADEDSIYIEYK
jgi:hypothetical protein